MDVPTLKENARVAWAAVLSTEDAADAARAAWIAARDALDAAMARPCKSSRSAKGREG